LLSKSALFTGINIDEIKCMLGCLKPNISNYNKNDIITLSGEVMDTLGIVLAGEVTVSKENSAGNCVVMAVLKPADIFGEIAAFSDQPVWPATISANESSIVMFLPANKIVRGCENTCACHSRMTLNMLRIISNKALMLNRKVEYFSMKSIRDKISSYLLEQHKKTGNFIFMVPFKRGVLADFLNVSRPSLSREMCHMRDEGIIEFYRSSIRIKDIEALKRMSE
jgi:CRP-like cAMP-binding protein